MTERAIGVMGLGVMGLNLALNLDDKGFSVSGYDAWPEPVAHMQAAARGRAIDAFHEIEPFLATLRRPRRIVMLVKAGEIVDRTIAALRGFLEPGDILVDAGNEHFTNTERRARELAPAGVRFFGMGVSGGEEGARHGPSLMPGGDRAAYDELAPILRRIAAPHADGPCVTYVGPGGAGHYVKMVHNGIEYGDMQLIAEAYDVLRTLGGLGNDAIADVFDAWNGGELASYLVEITAAVLRRRDPLGGGHLVDAILDVTGMKGTGKWTVQDAAELGVPVPTIAASVESRSISARKAERVRASTILRGPVPAAGGRDASRLVDDVRAALYAAKVTSYAQGTSLLAAASAARDWHLDVAELARIWQGGCIIRAKLLGRIKAAYSAHPSLPSLLFDASLRDELAARQAGWRAVIGASVAAGLPVPAMSAALGYYDSLRRERLPANLTAAQRDYFGAHGYERVDREGSFHTDWTGGA
jgi:6-phosphogluconate dehydrogenase